MNMQKLHVDDFVIHTPTKRLGTIVKLEEATADVRIEDKENGKIISSVVVTVPKVELKIISSLKTAEELAKKLAQTTKNTTETISKGYTKFAKKGEDNMILKVTKTVEAMVELIATTSKGTSDLLKYTNLLLEKVDNAKEKELKVGFPASEMDKTVAMVDALTDTNYFINGSFVEIAIKPTKKVAKHKLFEQVKEFHTVGGHPVAKEVTPMTLERVTDRCGYTVEELVEFAHAISKNESEFLSYVYNIKDTVRSETREYMTQLNSFKGQELALKQADALDKQHKLVLELFKEINMPSVEFADIVHEANMTKFYKDENGNYYAKRRESDGKIMKSPDFVAPEPKIKKLVNSILEKGAADES